MDESRGDVFYQIANDDRRMGLDKLDARNAFKKVRSWETSLSDKDVARDALIEIAKRNRLDMLADTADAEIIPGTPES